MRKSFIISLFFLICTRATAQEDSLLTIRLNTLLSYTEAKNYTKILDYTYPKIFTLISRELMLEALKSSFETEEFIISFDSMIVTKIYPVFIIEDESFTKVNHTMRMKMKFEEPIDTTYAESANEMMEVIEFMEMEFGEGSVRYDKSIDAFIINTTANLVAIKTREDNQWYFVNFDEDNFKMQEFLFSKTVLEKLETYK